MWSRESIKTYAKDFLKKHYWKAFLVCLIFFLLGGYSSGDNFQVNTNTAIENNHNLNLFDIKIPFEITNSIETYPIRKFLGNPILYISLLLVSMGFIVAIFFGIFLIPILDVGKSRFFLKALNDDVEPKYLFSSFNKNEYLLIVKTHVLSVIYVLLWSLLLIIPGIIKSYEYRFTSYILAETPNLTASEVLERSKKLTYGHKMDMFVLDLSFIGWHILGLIFFGIGEIFVNPYVEATYARLYNILSSPTEIDDNIVY